MDLPAQMRSAPLNTRGGIWVLGLRPLRGLRSCHVQLKWPSRNMAGTIIVSKHSISGSA
jgi:hypothetical protein